MKKVTMGDIPRTPADMAPLGSGGLMTGTQVWRQAILNPDDSSNFNFAIVAFDAGSRNKFHIHSGDQILVITEGKGKVATDDEVLEVVEGDVVVIPGWREPLARRARRHRHGPHHHYRQGQPDRADRGVAGHSNIHLLQADGPGGLPGPFQLRLSRPQSPSVLTGSTAGRIEESGAAAMGEDRDSLCPTDASRDLAVE